MPLSVCVYACIVAVSLAQCGIPSIQFKFFFFFSLVPLSFLLWPLWYGFLVYDYTHTHTHTITLDSRSLCKRLIVPFFSYHGSIVSESSTFAFDILKIPINRPSELDIVVVILFADKYNRNNKVFIVSVCVFFWEKFSLIYGVLCVCLKIRMLATPYLQQAE